MWQSAASAADITGTWLTEDGRARIRTEGCRSDAALLCGYVVWSNNPVDPKGQPRVDETNPDPGKRKRPVVGHQLLLGLRPVGSGRYEGPIYNADNGKSYDVTVWSERSGELSLKGCMLSVFCGSQIWKRMTDAAPGQLLAPTDGPGGPRSDLEWTHRTATEAGSAAASAQRTSSYRSPKQK